MRSRLRRTCLGVAAGCGATWSRSGPRRRRGLVEAAALAVAPFMSGFNFRDAPDFEEWQFLEAEALSRELAEVLTRLATGLIAGGDYAAAAVHARRLLALDPLNEEAHRLLMRLYAYGGDQAAALRQYRECVRILDQDLGVAPLSETTELYQAIRENRVYAARARVETPHRPVARGPRRTLAQPAPARCRTGAGVVDAGPALRAARRRKGCCVACPARPASARRGWQRSSWPTPGGTAPAWRSGVVMRARRGWRTAS